MSCARFADEVLEHALGEPAGAELRAHLPGCEGCRAALARERALLASIDGELRQAVAVEPPLSLLPRVRQEVGSLGARPSWGWLRPWPIAAALAAAAALFVLRESPDPVAPAAPPAPAVAEAVPPPAPTPATLPEAPRSRQPRSVRRSELPVVLVPAGEEELLRRYVAAQQTHRVEVAARADDANGLAIPPLERIPALEVPPLASGADPEGDDE